MATLDQLRALFPDASSDADVITQASKEFGISPTEIAGEIGYKIPKGGLTSQQVSSSLDQYQAGLYGVGEAAAKSAGLTGVGKWAQAQREENELQADIASARARELGAVDQWKNVHGVGDFGSYAKGLAIQSLPYAAEAMAGGMVARGAMSGTRAALTAAEAAKNAEGIAAAKKALDLGSLAGATAASYPSSLGDILQNQREQTGGTTNLGTASLLAAPYAAFNALGETGLLAKGALPKNPMNLLDSVSGVKGAVARGGAALVKTGAEESLGETGQEVINQLGRMSVDKTATLTDPEALERYKESAIGGFALGGLMGGATGWRRSKQDNSNDIADAIESKDTTQPDVTTADFQPRALSPALMAGLAGTGVNPLAGRSTMLGGQAPATQEHITPDGEIIRVPAGQQPPAVSGGSTEIAQAQAQAKLAQQQQEAQAQQQAVRNKALEDFSVVTNPEQRRGQFLGQPLLGINTINQVGDAIAPLDAAMEPHQRAITQAIIAANSQTGGKLVSFSFNANKVQESVQKGFEDIAKAANKFQIAHVQSVDEAAENLEIQSQTAKGNQLDQINAIHQALTGQNTTGYEAAQQPKGAKNGKQQATTGLGEVPVKGGAGETVAGGNGSVRPAEVQPVRTGSVGEGPLGLQTGQPPTSGVRTSPSAGTSAGVSEPVGPGQGQGQVNAQAAETPAAVPSAAQNATERRADENLGAVPAAEQEPIEERQVEGVPDLIRGALRMIYKSDRKIDLLLRLTEKTQRSNYAELAKEYDVTEQYVKDLANDAITDEGQDYPRFILANLDKFMAAVNHQAEKSGISVLEALDALQTIHDVYEGGVAGHLGVVADEADLINNGLEIQNLKERTDNQGKGTGKIDRTNVSDLAEEGNKMEALMQQYLDLSNQLADAQEANDERVEGLEKQIDELTAKIAEAEKKEKARVRETAGKQAPKETENAVQEPSAEEVPVRQRARGGKAVGKGNAERGKAATQSETKTEEKVKTPKEQYEALAAQVPGLPAYDSLDKAELAKIEDQAHQEGGLTLAALQTMFGESPKFTEGPKLASKSAPSGFMTYDEANDHIFGLELVHEQLGEAGIGDAVYLVSDWELTNDSSKTAEHGSLRTVQGRYVGTLNMAKLTNPRYAAEVARHEIAHAIDMGPHGGIYSAQPEMGVSVTNGKIKAEGPVAKELFGLYQNDAKWGEFLEYPFDSKKHPELNNRTKVQLELFAQAFSIYTTPEGRALMEAQAPVTAAYFKEVIQDVKSTKPLQIQKAEIAALRTAVLHTRRESKGNRGPSKVLGFHERVEELVASRSKQSDLSQPAGIFSKAGSWLDDVLTNPKEALRKLKLGFLTLDQLAELDKTPGQVVRNYSDVMTAMQKLSKDMVYKAAQIDQLWAKLSPTEAAKLSEVMRAATRAGFDPDKPHGPVRAEDATKAKLVDDFAALTPAAQDIYRKVRKHYEDSFNARLDIMREVGGKLGGKALEEIDRLYSKLQGPYFPLGRTGRYFAVGMSPELAALQEKKDAGELTRKEAREMVMLRKDANHYQTFSFDTLKEAKKKADELRADLGYAYHNVAEERLSTELANRTNFAKLEERINAELGGEARAEVRSMLSQMMFDMLPEHHALKRQMKREGIHGEDTNMRRVFAQTSISQAHYISRLKFSNELDQAMRAVNTAARRDIEMREIENELKLRTKVSMDNTQSALVDSLVNASYFAHLGLSPAFLLTNMTQVPMITAPWLGARHGVGATKRAMAMALADTAKIIKSSFKDGDWRSEINWSELFPAGSNEDRMFRDLLDRNVLDITMEHDLAAVASAQKSIFDDKIAKATGNRLGGLGDVVKLVNTPVRVTELANRAVTALSAYRLKMEALASHPTMTPEERHTAAVDYAARAVSETQLNYSELNAPRHMRQVLGSKPIAKMVFQFRKFQQGMLYLVAKNIADSLPGSNASKEDRRIARRTIAGLYMTTGLMAGTTGMPLMGTVGVAGIANLIAAAFGDDDEPWDFETEYRNFLTDWLGHDAALLVAKGIPAALGADISQRVGMGEIANPIPFVQRGATGQSTIANAMYAAGGASVGMAGTMYDGIVAMANGDVMKGMEKVIPVKAVKDALRTYRYADEGMTDKRGNVILAPEKFDTMDLVLRGMGFTPTKESEYYAANTAMQEAKTAATDVRTRLLREYSEAKLKGEPTEDVDAKIADFNERHPEKSVKIDMSAKLKSVQARRKMAAERTESGLRVGKYEKPFAGQARFAEEE